MVEAARLLSESTIFLFFAISIIGILLWQVCKKGNLIYGLLLFFSLIILSATYLFQFGELGSFIFSSKWADVKFIKEKRKEARQGAEEIAQIKKQLQQILEDSRHRQKIILETQERILSLEKDLIRTTEMAKPPTLSFYSKRFEKGEAGYAAQVLFKSSKNKHPGQVTFCAKILNNPDSKIVNFGSAEGVSFGEDSKKITKNGKEARISYNPMSVGCTGVNLLISKPAEVLISGSHELEEFIIDIK